MISSKLSSIFHFIIQKCENFTNHKYWIVWLALLSSAFVIFFSYPAFTKTFGNPNTKNWDSIYTQIKEPFTNHYYNPISHQSKLTFRLTVPLIAKILHLRLLGIIILQYFFGILLFYISSKVLLNITKDKISTLIISLSIPFLYIGRVSFVDLQGIFDGIALFFLILSLYKQNCTLIIISVFLSSLTDERGLIASSLVFVYWYIHDSNVSKKIFTKYTSSVIIGGLIYLLVRFLLIYFFNLKTQSGGIGLKILASNLNLIPLGIWHGMEGNWIVIILSIYILFYLNEKLKLYLFLFAILCVITTSCLVFDITRSIAYIFPALFISLKIVSENDTLHFLRKIALISTICSFIYPAYSSGGGNIIEWNYPLIIRYTFNFFTS